MSFGACQGFTFKMVLIGSTDCLLTCPGDDPEHGLGHDADGHNWALDSVFGISSNTAMRYTTTAKQLLNPG